MKCALVITIIVCYIIERAITAAVCKSLCSGKWERICKSVKGYSLTEKITLSYMLKQKSKHHDLIIFEVTAVNVNAVTSVLFIVSIAAESFEKISGIIWLIFLLTHLLLRAFVFRSH